MAIVVSQLVAAPMLQDVFVDKNGDPLSGGIINLYEDMSRLVRKNWYYQISSPTTPGAYSYITLPNPMTLSAAGTIIDVNGNDTIPFFYPWDEEDSTKRQAYYITVDNSDEERQFTRENFPFQGSGGITPPPSSGGETLDQYIVNNRFWRNIGSLNALTLANSIQLNGASLFYATIAPSQHDGFFLPDFTFVKNINGGQDTITFQKFLLGDVPLIDDITPEYYINHVCSSSFVGESFKAYQFPVCFHVQNLDFADATTPRTATFTFQAMNNGGTTTGSTVTINLFQYLGTGVTSPTPFELETFVLTGTWDKYSVTFEFPSLEGAILSVANDSAYYIQLQIANSEPVNINFTLPSLYLGVNVPSNSFTTYDQEDAIINSPRTGDIRTSINTFYPYGWVPMNDGTLVSPGTVTAPASGIAYQGPDGFPLYNLLWNTFKPYDTGSNSNPLAQMYSSAGTATNYSTSAFSDWAALKQLSLSKMMGRVLMGTAPVPALTKPYSTTYTAASGGVAITASSTTAAGASGRLTITTASTVPYYNGMPIVFSTTGTTPGGITAGTTYYVTNFNGTNVFYVSTTQSNSGLSGASWIAFSSAGSSSTVSNGLTLTVDNTVSLFNGMPIFVKTTGAVPGGLAINTIYYVTNFDGTSVFNLSTTFQNAIDALPIPFTTAGTGTQTVVSAYSGTFIGEYEHVQLLPELAGHSHYYTHTVTNIIGPNGGGTGPVTTTTDNTSSTGANTAFNVIQPSTFMNMYIKL